MLDNSIITIDEAINITETEDFKRINSEKISETMEIFAEDLKRITYGITEKINKLFESTNLKNTLNLFRDLAKGTIIDDEENDKNDEDTKK